MDKQDELFMAEGEVCSLVRSASKRVTGGNCAFVDDDIKILEVLASRAVKAGLFDGLPEDIRLHCARAALSAAVGEDIGGGRG